MGKHEEPLVRELERAIDANDLDSVKALMTAHPELHTAPLGYGEDGPLTWVAECREPWEPPGEVRLAIAEWMILNGSDVHQGGDGPLMRAALNTMRIPMMELLVAHGADVNALWHGDFAILFAPCESSHVAPLKWLLEHGANPNPDSPLGTALDYLISCYVRAPERLRPAMDLLLNAGGRTRYNHPALLALLRGRMDELSALIDADPALLHQRFPDFNFGQSGGRQLTLEGATLLHVAAEFCDAEAATLLLDLGADVNATGMHGQTPIFHSVTQFWDSGLDVTRVLLERGADLSLRLKLPGDYDKPGDIVEANPLEYALLFGGDSDRPTVKLLTGS